MSDPAPMGNPVKRRLAADELVLMMSLRQLRTPDAAMIVRECGFDGFYVDCEHGNAGRVHLLDRCPDRRIVVNGVLQRLVEGERRDWRRGGLGTCRGREDAEEQKRDGRR